MVEPGGDVVEVVCEEVGVHVESHRGRCVAEHPLYSLDIRARGDGQAGRGVPQVVDAHVARQSCRCAHPRPGVANVDPRARPVATGANPDRAGTSNSQKVFEYRHSRLRQNDLPRAPAFRARHRDQARAEIDLLPFGMENLVASGPCQRQQGQGGGPTRSCSRASAANRARASLALNRMTRCASRSMPGEAAGLGPV